MTLKNSCKASSSQVSICLEAVNIEITNRCNFSCIHCSVRNCGKAFLSQKELTTKEACVLLDQVALARAKSVLFSGGEPLIRKDIWKLFEYARKHRLQLTLSTNASLITREAAKRLADLGIEVTISLYGMDEKNYGIVTRGKNAFQRVLHGIESLVAERVRIVGRMPLLKQTIGQWGAFESFAKKVGFKQIVPIYRIHATFDGHLNPFKYWISAGQLEDFFFNYPQYGGKENHGAVGDRRPCGVATKSVTITAFGDILPCHMFRQSKSNIKEVTISEACVSPEYREIRRYLSKDLLKCFSCQAHQFCEPCIARFFLVTGNYIVPDKFTCKIAWARKRAYERWQKIYDACSL